jgi:UDP-N-acetylmuramyl pentapeptide phosphotransferase/UDP-N-acetylglucosamine-1-phosphate transferase
MSPLHHHMELGGLPETAVVYRLWLLGLLCAAAAYLAFWA